MESAVVEPKRRGRKRKKVDEPNVMDYCGGKRKLTDTRSLKLVGRYVRKEFEGSGVFLGKITFYDNGLYRINYEDGDFEDLDSGEVKVCLVGDCDLIGEWSERKSKLNELLLAKDVNAKVFKVENALEAANVNQVDSSVLSELSNGEASANAMMDVLDDGNHDADADSLSDSCDDTEERVANIEMEEPLIPPPELPLSSGHIGAPEDVSHLFSVHGFLRSFSVQLFIYPFGLDDFVGALNCSVANTLLDSVHVALLRVLKRHIERLSSDGSELASKCMRCVDWSMMDNLTWPVYLVHYLMVMGYKNGPDRKEFYAHSLERDYYTLSARKKLVILQILCDDVLDSEELREEMDMREESEVGVDIDTSTVVRSSGGSRRFHPRYYKKAVSKGGEAIMSTPEHHEIKSSLGSHSMHVVESIVSSAEDSNGDECRICGMDGLLLCCDGCPSSYHSRCLGLNKMHMPEGSWYCPECKVNATEPKILQGTTLRGGHNFGIDPYGQVFVATCDHLLVLNASNNSEVCLRYYNRHDIPRVLHCLYSNAEHVVTYSEICKGIMQYWELPEDILPCSQMSEVGLQIANEKGHGECNNHLDNLLNTGSCENGISAADTAALSLTNCVQDPVLNGNSLDEKIKSDQFGNTDSTTQQSCYNMNTTIVEPISFGGLIGQPADTSGLRKQSTSSVTGTVSDTARNCHVNYSGPVYGASQETKMSLPYVELNNRVDRKTHGNPYDGCLYMGSSFKTTGYINNYLHGDFAASAAANLAIFSSEENQVLEPRSSYNRRKGIFDNVSLQVKAFSSAAIRFFWPNSEKKLVDIPRERCTWCFSCKAPVASKKACLLNVAALNASRGTVKVPAGVRPLKNGDSRLPGIVTYILYIEESLSGLVVGPFLNDAFRKRWRKQVEQASTCNAIKILLLELEENVLTIALSGDWVKLVDGCSTQSPNIKIAANVAGSTQKRKPGRRGKKPPAVVEVASDDCQDLSNDFTWWRGGTLSKLMFQRTILPSSMIRKAARQGGSKRIPGLHYVGGHETPKSSRQLIWRSAVEMSRNMAQLALQIRYLDFHVRWSDLVRPEQTPPDGKGPDTEASAYRNAFICHKKTVEHEIRYCVAFGSQKHLPSRVLKNIAEVEKILDDGKERYWFSETRIPLYLIKDYEEKVEKSIPVDVLSKLQRRQRKASRKNIFSYLSRKQDNMAKSYCCSCHQDVLHRNAVKCSACQGFCHEKCATSSTVHINDEVEFLITCKHCCEPRAINQVQSSYGSPTSPLLLQVRDFPNAGTSSKRGKVVGYKGSRASVETPKHSSEMKPSKNKHWGLIWQKKNYEDTGVDFRLKNILLRGNPDMDLTEPPCRLCNKPYNADLMYIRCESCQYWFHADALELDESKISCLVGYKCCKCRRIKSPVCPYSDTEKKKIPEDKIESRTSKLDIYEMDSNSRSAFDPCIEGQAYSALPTNAEITCVAGDDNLLLSLSEVEQCTETSELGHEWNNSNISCSGPRKLPVRRHIKQENNIFNSTGKLPIRRHVKRGNKSEAEASNPSALSATTFMRGPLSPSAQWAVSNGNLDDGIMLDYDCLGYDGMEFEPQTYFSFNDLLASDEGGRTNENESMEIVVENWENSSVLPETEFLEISYDEEEPIISVGTTIEIAPCNICCQSEPCPDLCCQVCGKWVHSLCSPWLNSLSSEDSWRCGSCHE